MKINTEKLVIICLVALNIHLLYKFYNSSNELKNNDYLLRKFKNKIDEDQKLINYFESNSKMKYQLKELDSQLDKLSGLNLNKSNKFLLIYLSDSFCYPCLEVVFQVINNEQFNSNYEVILISSNENYKSAKKSFGLDFPYIDKSNFSEIIFIDSPFIYVRNDNGVLSDNFLTIDYQSIDLIAPFLKSL